MYIHVHTCTYMYIHVHTCTYMYIHVHTYILQDANSAEFDEQSSHPVVVFLPEARIMLLSIYIYIIHTISIMYYTILIM